MNSTSAGVVVLVTITLPSMSSGMCFLMYSQSPAMTEASW